MKIRGSSQIIPGSVVRSDMDVATAGSAVITKMAVSSRFTMNSTGIDAGTGDVTLDLALTGVSAGRYTGVNVDVYGRVVSGSALVATDLPVSGVSASSYTKVTVDVYGRVTAGMNLGAGDVPANSSYYIQNQVASVQNAGFSISGVASVGSIKLLNTTGTFGVSLVAPANQASNVSFVLPGYQGGANTTIITDGNGNLSWATAGTVTSVGLTLPSQFVVSNSPVTASGSLTATWASQSANAVFAGPTTGSAAPTFRALIAADIPALAYLSLSGGSVTGTVTITATPNLVLQTALSAVNSQGCFIQNKLQDVNTAYQTYSATHTDIIANAYGAYYGRYAISVAASGVLMDVATFSSSLVESKAKHSFIAASLASASVNIAPTTLVPSTPVDGDMWMTSAGLFARINGASVQLGSGSGTVTSVGFSAPSIFTVSGSPITGAGTISLSLNTTSQNFVFAGPTSGTAIPAFRALVAADIPSLSGIYLLLAGGTLSGSLTLPAASTTLESVIIPHGTAPTTPTNGSVWTTTTGMFVRLNGTTRTLNISAATVTSVALSLPSIFSVTGSPVTTSGTLTATLASQAANTLFAAPNGSAGAPSFRALVSADIPALGYLPISGGTLTGKLITQASVAGSASVTVPVGNVPSSPVSGDLWNAANDLYFFTGTVSAKIFNSANLTSLTLPGGPYLPLTGGTLTGTLNGTAVSVTGNVSAASVNVTGLTTNAYVYSAAGGALTSATLTNGAVSYTNFGTASNTVSSSVYLATSGYGLLDANGLGWNAAFLTDSATYFGITQKATLASNYKTFVIGAADGRVQLSIDKTNLVSVPGTMKVGNPSSTAYKLAVEGGSLQVQAESNVSLLMHFDSTAGSRQFQDMTGKSVSSFGKYPNSAVASSTQSKFGGTSLFLDGISTRVEATTSTADFNFGSGDFTVEGWFFFASTSGTRTLIDIGGSAAGVRLDYNGSAFVLSIVGTASTLTQAVTASTWYHIAITRSSGTVKFFFNGASVGTPTGTGSVSGITACSIGSTIANTQFFSGYVDEVRVLKGLAAWTTTVTIPTAPYDYGSLTMYGSSSLADSKVLVSDKSGRASVQRAPRTVSVTFALGETVTNTTKYFYLERCLGSTQDDAQRSGSTNGMVNSNSCSPWICPFNGRITQAVLNVSGAGVNQGSVSYPVSYNAQMFRVGTNTEHDASVNGGNPVTLSFQIPNTYTVYSWYAGATHARGIVLPNLNVPMNVGDPVALKFVNGSTSSVVGISLMAFVTLVIEETF